MPRRPTISERLYRTLLVFFPRDLRRDVGDDMVRLFVDRLRHEDRASGRVALWVQAVVDALEHGLAASLAGRLRLRFRPARWSMSRTLQDIRFALRVHRRSPGLTVIAIVTIALGIGATTVIFSFADALLARPLPVSEPGRVVALFHVGTEDTSRYSSFSYPDFVELRDQNTVLSGLAAWSTISLDLGESPTEPVEAQIVSGNYFNVLGVEPAPGRSFLPAEDLTPDTHPVAVVSHAFWRDRLAANGEAVGSTIRLNGRPFLVIGVAPEEFHGLELSSVPEVWVPLMMHATALPSFRAFGIDLFDNRGTHWLELTGRLETGVRIPAADGALRAIAERQARENPDTNRGWSVAAVRAGDARLGPPTASPVVRLTVLLAVVVGLVLAIACANVANLLLARAVSRRREIGVRLAVGAARGRIVRQLLTESVLLAGAGGAVGIALAVSLMSVLPSLDVTNALPGLEARLDGRVLVFTVLLTMLTGVVFGLAPALQAAGITVAGTLKSEGQGGGSSHSRMPLRQSLMVAQVAMCMVLLIGAGLTLRSVQNLRTLPLGFEPADLWMSTVDVTQQDRSAASGRQVYTDLSERLRAMPSVESVALGLITPFGRRRMANDVLWDPESLRDEPSASGLTRTNVDMNVVDGGYFDTMRIPVIRGRAFGPEDGPGSPDVAVINRAMAERFWPAEQALGRQLWSWSRDGDHRALEVVGIVENGRYYRAWRLGDRPFLFVPFAQWYQGTMAVHVRGRALTAADLRQAVAATDASLPSIEPRRADDAMAQSMAVEQMSARLLGAFGLLAITIAAIGIYGVVSFLVGERTYEIGLRIALGAPTPTILRLVLVGSVRLVLAGIAIGWVAAIGLSQLISSVLFGVRSTDPVTFAAVSVFLLLIGVVASYWPARRAMGIDPLRAVRAH